MSETTHEPHDRDGLPSVAELIPHEAPMILVDELVEWTPERALIRAQVRRGGPFVSEGRMPATILLEYMAQAIAVAEGMGGRTSGRREIGLLLGARELNLEVDEVAAGDALELHVDRQFADGRVASYACEVRRDGELLARATVNVMIAPPEAGTGVGITDDATEEHER